MNPDIPKLKAWLESHECYYVRPCELIIEKLSSKSRRKQRDALTLDHQVFEGCIYRRRLKYTEGMTAVTRGDKKAGDTYVEVSAYLLGEIPKCYQKRFNPRHNKTCLQVKDGTDWYLACHISKEAITPRIAKYHPFGPSFIVKPWLLAEKIDAYERHPKYWTRHVPYTRYPIVFQIDYKSEVTGPPQQPVNEEHPSGLTGEHDVVLDAIQECCLGGKQ